MTHLLLDKLSISEFNAEILKLTRTPELVNIIDPKVANIFKDMNVDFKIFKSGVSSFLPKLNAGVAIGLDAYRNDKTSFTESIASFTKGTFENLEDALVKTFNNEKDAFADFANFVVGEIQRMVIRLSIIIPLVEGIQASMQGAGLIGVIGNLFSTQPEGALAGQSGLLSGSSGPSPTLSLGSGLGSTPYSLKTMTNNYDYSTQKSVLNQQQEQGLNIQIINNTSSEVSVRENQTSDGLRSIEVMIDAKVNKGFSEGKYDSSLKNNFGVMRKGY